MLPTRRASFLLVLSVVSLALLISVLLPLLAQPSATKRALLIGIDDYAAPSVADLGGCVNDIELMKTVLVGKFEVPIDNILVLKNEQATRSGILNAIRQHLIKPAQPGDVVILHYSGHGSRMRDRSGDELDGWDETIVPHDSRQDSVFDISDDELNGLMLQLSQKTPHVIFMLDSCHSGSGIRAVETGNTVRQIPPDPRMPPEPLDFATGSRGLTEGVDDFRLPGAGYALISGCRANELSNETSFGGQLHGAMTYFLARALRTAGESNTYRDIIDGVKADVSGRFPAQHPQVEGPGLDNVIFGDRQILPQPFVLVEPKNGHATLLAGEIYGVKVGTELDVFPPGTKLFDGSTPSTARVRVLQVGTFESTAEILGGGTIASHSRAVPHEIRPGDFQVGVFFRDAPASSLLAQVKEALAAGDYEAIRIVDTTEDAQIRIRTDGSQVFLEGRDLETLSIVSAKGPSAKQAVLDRIAHWARWHAILAIENPSPTVDVDLRVHRAGVQVSEPPPESITSGICTPSGENSTEIAISVTNRSGKDLYITLLDLASDGSVNILYPKSDIPDSLPAGKTLPQRIGACVPKDRQISVDIVKLIATTKPISPAVFSLGPVPRSHAPQARSDENPLERFIRRSVQGLTRNLHQISVDGWEARQRILRVVHPDTRMPHFALHFDNELDASRASATLSARGTRAVCSSPSDPGCYELVPLAADSRIVRVRTPAARSGQEAVTSVGEAFEQAYALAEETGAKRAEPLFDLRLEPVQTAPHPDSAEARGMGAKEPDPRAEADPLWSLKYARVPEAWATIRSIRGKTHGAEAEGIVIAHVDTGYRPHPEIWSDQPDQRPVWTEKGYDYYGKDDDAIDDLESEGILDHPAHGTGSGSAIVSPPGCQLAGATKCPTGVALGARLVPLRVHRSVVHFSTGRLSQAIRDASGEDRSRVKAKPHMMSIAMGGLPSWSLWKAVKQAEERGLLIIAAAGNYVKKVVWPARFESTIAVGAVNAGCRPWSHTSLGPSVDISAPGESVWRATLSEGNEYVTGMGTGTTYATSTVAGIAALWLARHKGTPAFEALRQRGAITQTFRRLVQETAWRPGAEPPAAAKCDDGVGWSSFFHGAGIIDAAELLARPLDADAQVRGLTAPDLEDLPLWQSLYPAGSPPETAISDYRRLFPAGDSPDRVGRFEAEILHHYATGEDVASAIDAIATSGDRGEEAFARVRDSLRARDLSSRLRQALR